MSAIAVFTHTFTATADLKAGRLFAATGAYPSAAGNALGVLTADAAKGALVAVDLLGTSRVTAGDAITAGAWVQAGDEGKVVPHAGGKAVGLAMTAASADGEQIEMLILPNTP